MNIDETAIYVNKRLTEGYSIAKTERNSSVIYDTKKNSSVQP